MAAIRPADTVPELALRRHLRAHAVTGYRCNYKGLPGKPDIVFTRWRVAVFVDGGFWHGHPDKFAFGRWGEYWDAKVARNMERDRENDRRLTDAGYAVLRFWDFDVKRHPERCVAKVLEALSVSKAGLGCGGSEAASSSSERDQATPTS